MRQERRGARKGPRCVGPSGKSSLQQRAMPRDCTESVKTGLNVRCALSSALSHLLISRLCLEVDLRENFRQVSLQLVQ
eukprot:scaffold115381_cov31-Tisochrysis_lutea.AAC.3